MKRDTDPTPALPSRPMPGVRAVTVLAAIVALWILSGRATAHAQTEVAQLPEAPPRPAGPAEPRPNATSRGSVDALAAGTVVRGTDLFDDGHSSDHPAFDAGLAVQYLRRVGSGGWRIGAGARYGLGAGRAYGGAWAYEQVLTVPLLVGWAWRFGATGEELEFLIGVGPGFMFLSFGTGDYGAVTARGVAAEVGLNYVRPLTPRLAIVIGVAACGQSLYARGPANTNIDGAVGFHGEIPLRVGLRYRL